MRADVDAADRITRDRVVDYVGELDQLGNISSTILSRLEELDEMAKVVGPKRNWSFINRLAAKVRARPKPPSTKQARLVGSDELVAIGLSVMEAAEDKGSPRCKAVRFRDGLIIALLALRPMRRKNLTELSLGSSLVQAGSDWMIILLPEAGTRPPRYWPFTILLTFESPRTASVTDHSAPPRRSTIRRHRSRRIANLRPRCGRSGGRRIGQDWL